MSIFNSLLQRRHIILHKGKNWHILLTLAWNQILLLKLRIYKRLHNIHRSIVHYYAVCWNEERMLPFVFRHFDQFVDHYTFYDNYSDDRSEEIIRSHKNTSIIKFKTEGFDDMAHINIKNNCWKRSRGKADYVIVCDIDEFLYHADFIKTITQLKESHISLPSTIGYNMYSPLSPTHSQPLTDQVRQGITDPAYNKSIIFDPHRIVEINYQPGAHIAEPTGIVKKGDITFKLLHYKNIGLDYVLERYHILAHRLSDKNKEEGLGTHYLNTDEKIISDFNEGLSRCETVI